MKQGFTFLEILVALAVSLVLVSVTSSALITALRTGQAAEKLHHAVLVIHTVATGHYLGRQADAAGVETMYPEWSVGMESAKSGDGPDWQVWHISPRDRPSLAVRIALREADRPEQEPSRRSTE